MSLFSLSPQTILLYLTRLMIIFLINPLHEYAHAWTAHKLGDDTAKNEGRLTISPLAHLDGLGALMLLFWGFGWAKPVPVSPSKFKKPSLGLMLTAIAGPISNLIAAFLGVVALQLCGGSDMLAEEGTTRYYAAIMLYEFVVVNLNLFLFNMIPVPPLDGSRVLTFFLPPKASLWVMRYQPVFYGVVLFLMLTGILTWPLAILNDLIFAGMAYITDFIPAVL